MLLSSGVKKILICAPSNAAVDEIITRLSLRGLVGVTGQFHSPSFVEETLVRLGAMEYEPSPIVKKHTLDVRLEKQLIYEKTYKLKEKIAETNLVIEEINKPDFTQFKLDAGATGPEKTIFEALRRLVTNEPRRLKKWLATKTIDEQKNHFKKSLRDTQRKLKEATNMLNRKDIMQGEDWQFVEGHLIGRSAIVCCTLSMAGIEKMRLLADSVDYLIVDEACQSTEPTTLIPFQLNPRRVILVGD